MVVRGRLDLYSPRGTLQLVVDRMEPQGLGALRLAFEQLKARLEAEGLFAPERKRPLPRDAARRRDRDGARRGRRCTTC